MPIIKFVPKECSCIDRPNKEDYGVGTVWECDLCKKRWILVEFLWDYSKKYKKWREQ